jgi:putative transposase
VAYTGQPEHCDEVNQKIYAQAEVNHPIEGNRPYVFFARLWLKRSLGEVRTVSLLVAIGVNAEGVSRSAAVDRRVQGRRGQLNGLRHPKERRPNRVRLFVSDKCLGLVKSTGEFYPEALWQRCAEHFYRNVWTAVPTSRVKEAAAMLKAMHALEDRVAARQKAEQIAVELKVMKLADAAELVRTGIEETLYYYAFSKCGKEPEPLEHFRMGIRADVGCRQAATGGPPSNGVYGRVTPIALVHLN